MKSPFPGMDPYLEEHWGDVHTSLVTYARDHLQRQLPGDLKVRVEEHITVQDQDDDGPKMLEPETLRTVLIIDAESGNRVITRIEFLRASKEPTEQERAGVNVVEIDLLREGPYLLAAPYDAIPISHRGPYRVAVTRAARPDFVDVYRVALRERLPIIRIPLRPTDVDVFLDLQALIDGAYENGGYNDLDYSREPVPPLQGEDAEWAAGLLQTSARR